MPIYINRNGGNEWYKDEPKPALSVGTCKTQEAKKDIRQAKTVECTARSIKMYNDEKMTEQQLDEVIAKNAFSIGMNPGELGEQAQDYLDSQNETSRGIERE
ncbi:MAG: hypothetical protein RBR78_11890 [Flavobacteriaceae bacterium]|jgi:hypothetical protein|nr:hypothetical protein [Flavobacteriaceae bacterium]